MLLPAARAKSDRDASLGSLTSRYRPIADYGAIGDGRSLALVSSAGSIDFWCPARFDAPSLFASLLDADRGGHFTIRPTAAPTPEGAMPASSSFSSSSRYVEDTNVLDTEHVTERGRVRVRDLMPFEEDTGVPDSVILRRIAGLEGDVEMEAILAPRFQYARVFPRFSATPAGLLASGGGEILLARSHIALRWERTQRGVRRAVFRIAAGETIDIALRHAPFASPVPFAEALARPDDELEARAIARWRAWSARTRFDGAPADAALVRRSALALKLLQYQRNGAFVAAGTTSLPEAVGGIRNWDYRYTWVRDGAITARALHDAGHAEECRSFTSWIHHTLGADVESMRIMYTLSGSTHLPERELPHLEGYRGSAPVRTGNGAAHQRQLDVYGELADHLHATRAAKEDASSWPLVRGLADFAARHWREPDQGIWEMRDEPRHFVLSKAMAWAALDRACRMAQDIGEAPGAGWAAEAEALRAEVLEKGVHAKGFAQAFGFPNPDASNLLLPLIGFVDAKDPRMVATVDTILKELTVDGLVYRYLGDDGLPGGEATFAYCTFWLVEVLAMQGRVQEARVVFDRIASRASHLGLYAEEIDAATDEHLGNYPQAFPHAGLIQAARALAQAERST